MLIQQEKPLQAVEKETFMLEQLLVSKKKGADEVYALNRVNLRSIKSPCPYLIMTRV